MKKVYLCTPHKLGALNHEFINRIEKLGFEVLSAVTHTPPNFPPTKIFKLNVHLMKQADLFVVVLKDYGKDLTAEVGMAYGWGIPLIGIDYTAQRTDTMCFYAFEKIIKSEDLEKTLSEFNLKT